MHACCWDLQKNRLRPEALGPVEQDEQGRTLQRCTVCGARHFMAVLDAGSFALEFAPLR